METQKEIVPTLKDIKTAVKSASGINDLSSKSRLRSYTTARRAFYIIGRSYEYSLMQMGVELNRTHATVLHAIKYKDHDLATDQDLKLIVNHAKLLLKDILPAFSNDDESEYKREIYNLKQIITRLNKEKEKTKTLNQYLHSLSDLTEEQIKGIEPRLSAYASLCRANNAKQN